MSRAKPTPKRSSDRRAPRRQQGVASLFITAVLLLVVMMLGVTAMMLSGTQYRLAGNLQFENEAFNLAESAAAAAEQWLTTKTPSENWRDAGFTTRATATPQLWPIGTLTSDPLTMSASDFNAASVAVASGDDSRRYLIQKLGKDNILLGTGANTGGRRLTGCQKADIFRVTARGTSAKGTTRFVQTTYTIPSC
jgi:Tfp pilus assembly protein PilX